MPALKRRVTGVMPKFYGSIRVFITDEGGRDLDIADGVSRIGVKGLLILQMIGKEPTG